MDHLFNAGPISLVFLAFIPVWLFVSIRFLLGRTHHLLALFVFPVIFVMIALTSWVSFWYFEFSSYFKIGSPDPMQYVSSGLVITRFSLICLAVAWLSLATACLGFLKKNPPKSSRSD